MYFAKLDHATAARVGLPKNPKPGHTITSGPYTFVWYGDGPGLSGLGFWGVFASILGSVTGLFGKKGGDDKQARAQIEQQQTQIQQLQTQVTQLQSQPSVDKNMVVMIGLAVIGLMFFMK